MARSKVVTSEGQEGIEGIEGKASTKQEGLNPAIDEIIEPDFTDLDIVEEPTGEPTKDKKDKPVKPKPETPAQKKTKEVKINNRNTLKNIKLNYKGVGEFISQGVDLFLTSAFKLTGLDEADKTEMSKVINDFMTVWLHLKSYHMITLVNLIVYIGYISIKKSFEFKEKFGSVKNEQQKTT